MEHCCFLRSRRHILGAAIGLLMASPALAQTQAPGVVIDYLPASSGKYVGSPSISILPNGNYIATHDIFGPNSNEYTNAITDVFRSTDRGQTWSLASVVSKAFWSSTFTVGSDLYLLGPDADSGNMVIRKSSDGGSSWTTPTNSTNGLLLAKADLPYQHGFHQAPTPVIVSGGKIWHAFEDLDGAASTAWGTNFRARMGSIPVGADLLNSANWTFSTPVARPANWGTTGNPNAFLEGNAVADRNGNVLDMLRVDPLNKLAVMHANAAGTSMTFDPSSDMVDFNAGSEKVHILYDSVSDKYWAMGNVQVPGYSGSGTRNALGVYSSTDLVDWHVMKIQLFNTDKVKHGFQYPSFQFDGSDIVAVSRTAFDDNSTGADSYHNANYLTFHRISDFRNLTVTPVDTYLIAGTDHVAGRFEQVQGAGGPWLLNAQQTIKPDFDNNPATAPLANAFGLAQDNRGRIYVNEQQDAGRVVRFNSDKSYDKVVATEGAAGADFAGRPEAMTLGPDGNIYMSSAFGTRDVNTVYKIDLATNKVTAFTTGATMSDPRGIAFAADGNLYVADRNNNVIRKFDGVTGAYIGTVPNVPGRPQALAWDGDNNRLLDSSIASNKAAIDAYDLTTGARTTLYQSQLALNFLDVANINGEINVIDYGNGGSFKIIDVNNLAAVTSGQVGHMLSALKISTWTGSADANLSTAGNWSVAPTFNSGNMLQFSGAGATVANDRAGLTTLGGLNVAADAGAFTINGGAFNFNQIGHGVVNLGSGPLTLNSNLAFTSQPIDAASGQIAVGGTVSIVGRLYSRGTQTVTLGGAVTGAGSIVKLDANTLRLAGNNVFTGGILALGGTVELANAHAASTGTVIIRTGATLRLADDLVDAAQINSLTLDAGSKFDLRHGKAVLHYTASTPYSTILTAIGNNTVTSTLLDPTSAIGIIDSPTDKTLTFAYAKKGDADLSGTVDFDDLLALAQNYGLTGTALWKNGDSNYDKKVDFDDLLALAQNYGAGGPSLAGAAGVSPSFAADWALAQSLVPEPTTIASLASVALFTRRRRA